jgi:hypothetical protein
MEKTEAEQFVENQMIFNEAVKNGEIVYENEIGKYILKKVYGHANATFKDGLQAVIPTETIYTIYETGRKDCHVNILQAIDSGAVPLQPRGMEEGDK